MAKIIGSKLFGSASGGKLFGTSFVYYGSGYPGSVTYQRVRMFQLAVQDVPRFFIDRNFQFGVSFLYWDNCRYAYQSDYETWCQDEDVSALEGFVEDTTWIKENPCIQATPSFDGTLSLTDYLAYIKVIWFGTGGAPKPAHTKSFYLYRRCHPPGEPFGNWERLPRIEFKPYQIAGVPVWRQTIYLDYDVNNGWTYQYKFKLCSARIFCTAFSPAYEEDHDKMGQEYIDRGDPNAWDFTQAVLTIDGAYHDLDLSGIVPAAGANHLVHLKVDIFDNAADSWIFFREKGNANSYNKSEGRTQNNAVFFPAEYLVMMDSNRKIQYAVKNVAFNTITILVRGYWKDA